MGFLKSWCFIVVVVMWSCGNPSGHQAAAPDRHDSGTIRISADESFRPVIEEQVKVFEGSYPDAKIEVQYKPEAECVKDLFNDSVRMIITTRRFNETELQAVSDSLKSQTRQGTVAVDAIAVVVNRQSADSFFTMQEIKAVLSDANSRLQPVFDGLQETSTLRFMLDSLLKNTPLSKKVMAAPNSNAVLDYVTANKNAVGFLGVSWIGNKEDPAQTSFLKNVTIANIQSTDSPDVYVKPYQSVIYGMRYPMVRHLVYVLKEKHQGLGNAFADFMNGERGQLIFRRAYLLPAKMPFYLRDAALKE